MTKGITSEGFEFEIDERRVKDWRVQSAAIGIAKDPDSVDAKIDFFQGIRFVAGAELESKLVDHLTAKYGYADSDLVAQEIGEMYRIAKEALDEKTRKNSTSSSAASQPMRMPSSVISQRPMGYTTTEPSPSNLQQLYAPAYAETAELRRN